MTKKLLYVRNKKTLRARTKGQHQNKIFKCIKTISSKKNLPKNLMVVLIFLLIWHQEVPKCLPSPTHPLSPPSPMERELIFLCCLSVRVEDAEHLTRSCSGTTPRQVNRMILEQNWAKKENQACNIPWGLRKFQFPFHSLTLLALVPMP